MSLEPGKEMSCAIDILSCVGFRLPIALLNPALDCRKDLNDN